MRDGRPCGRLGGCKKRIEATASTSNVIVFRPRPRALSEAERAELAAQLIGRPDPMLTFIGAGMFRPPETED